MRKNPAQEALGRLQYARISQLTTADGQQREAGENQRSLPGLGRPPRAGW